MKKTSEWKKMVALIYLLTGLFLTIPINAQIVNHDFPKESLVARLNLLTKITGKNISFDGALMKEIIVPELKAENSSIDQLLTTCLSTTDFTYKKVSDNSYVIMPKSIKETDRKGAPGIIKGRVVEAETSDPLPGTTIKILDTNFAVVTDGNGYYSFPRVPSGKYIMEASFMSFSTEKINITVMPNRENIYDIKMSANAQELSEITVSAVRRQRGSVPHMTEQKLVQEIKELQVVASGISSEQISKSADRNAADAVRKISGVSIRDDKYVVVRGMNERYNLTYLNDNVAPSTELYSRAFALNLLPTRIIDKIVVYKTPSPELFGDMSGGAVKIYTKDAVAVRHFDVQVSVSARPSVAFKDNFISYEGGKYDYLGFDDGTRKLPSVVPGYGDFSRAAISQRQYAESFSDILTLGHKTALPDLSATINYYNAFPFFNRTLSLLTSLSYKNEYKQHDAERIQSAFRSDARTHHLIDESQSKQTAQATLLFNLSYRLNDRNNIQFKNFVLQQGESNSVYRTTNRHLIYTDNPVYNTPGMPSVGDGNPGWRKHSSLVYDERNIILGYTQRTLYTGNLTGKHQFIKERDDLNWNTGYMYSNQQIPDQRMIRLRNGVNEYFYTPGNTELHWLAAARPIEYGSEGTGTTDVERGIISRTWTRNIEKSYDASIDYSFKITDWVTAKAGTYHQWKERSLFRRAYTVNEGDMNEMGYPFSAKIGASGNYMDLNRIFFKEQDLNKVWSSEYLRDDKSALMVVDRTSGSDSYKASEQNNSGYLALSLKPFGEMLDIYGGVRVEYNNQKIAGAQPRTGGINNPIMVDNKNTDWLPSVNVSFRAKEQLIIRGAYGKTLNRPEFRELSPYSEFDYLNNQTIVGNSDLRSASITGYDFRVEWYYGNSGSNMINLGAFYKDITTPIERIVSRTLQYGSPTKVSFGNADKAEVKGLELEIRQSFNFIPLSVIRDMSITGNFTLVDSEATQGVKNAGTVGEIPPMERQLQGQAPYIVNVGLYYDNVNLGTKIGLIYNEIGPRIYAAASGRSFEQSNGGGGYVQSGDMGSIIELTNRQLDFSLTQRISKGLQLKFSVQNLLNQSIEMAEDENFTYKYEKAYFIPSAEDTRTGVKSDFVGDLISNKYKSDRYYNLTLTYSF